MTGIAHAMISWGIAQSGGDELRDRRLIAWLGVAPDFDVVGILYGIIRYADYNEALYIHAQVHHHYTHGFFFMLCAALFAAIFGKRKARAALLSAVAVGAHLLCDIIGSGYDWPLYPFWPLNEMTYSVPWSLQVFDPRIVWTGYILFFAAFIWGIKKGNTPMEMINLNTDRFLVKKLRREFHLPPFEEQTQEEESV